MSLMFSVAFFLLHPGLAQDDKNPVSGAPPLVRPDTLVCAIQLVPDVLLVNQSYQAVFGMEKCTGPWAMV
eukprot:g14801.t1